MTALNIADVVATMEAARQFMFRTAEAKKHGYLLSVEDVGLEWFRIDGELSVMPVEQQLVYLSTIVETLEREWDEIGFADSDERLVPRSARKRSALEKVVGKHVHDTAYEAAWLIEYIHQRGEILASCGHVPNLTLNELASGVATMNNSAALRYLEGVASIALDSDRWLTSLPTDDPPKYAAWSKGDRATLMKWLDAARTMASSAAAHELEGSEALASEQVALRWHLQPGTRLVMKVTSDQLWEIVRELQDAGCLPKQGTAWLFERHVRVLNSIGVPTAPERSAEMMDANGEEPERVTWMKSPTDLARLLFELVGDRIIDDPTEMLEFVSRYFRFPESKNVTMTVRQFRSFYDKFSSKDYGVQGRGVENVLGAIRRIVPKTIP
jgi:hypothetical protein